MGQLVDIDRFITPDVGASTLAKRRINVDFPAPFAPQIAKRSPDSRVKLKLANTLFLKFLPE